MSKFYHKPYIKIISLILVTLLAWQSVVWADPDLFTAQHISPRPMPDAVDRETGFGTLLAGYMLRKFIEAESIPENQNVPRITEAITAILDSLRNDDQMAPWMKELVPDITYDPSGLEEIEVSLDIGDFRIRYFKPDPEKQTADPAVLQDVPIGKYLARQVIRKHVPYSGAVSRGDAQELFNAFMSGSYVKGGLREALKSRMPDIIGELKRKVRIYVLEDDLASKINSALDIFANLKFIEALPLVLGDKDDPTEAAGWLLGFNTAEYPGAPEGGREQRLMALFREAFPDTAALSSGVLDLIENDELLLEEYIFHEAVCPLLRHTQARYLQEMIFSGNYMKNLGDAREGHKDGVLAVVMKSVIWSECESLPLPTEGAQKRDGLHELRGSDFTGEGPQKAARFFYRHKIWYERVRRTIASRWAAYRGVAPDAVLRRLEIFARERNYVIAKTAWIWNMEMVWSKAEAIMMGREFSDLEEYEKARVKAIAQKVLEAHDDFMRAAHLLGDYLSGDVSVERALQAVRAILEDEGTAEEEWDRGDDSFDEIPDDLDFGIPEPINVPIKSGPMQLGEEASQTEKNTIKTGNKPEKASSGRSVKFPRINWADMAASFAASIAITAVLYLILPVNAFTLILAFVLPVGVFAYLMVRNWSWMNFMLFVAVSAVFTFIAPIPWFGLSMAIVALIEMRVNKYVAAKGASLKAATVKSRKISLQEAAGIKEDEPPSDERRLSTDVIDHFLKILRAMNRELETAHGGAHQEELDAYSVMDAVFLGSLETGSGVDPRLKEQLRQFVNARLEAMDLEFDLSMRDNVEKLKDWEFQTDETLAVALDEVFQEIGMSIGRTSSLEDNGGEMPAIQELIGEYFKIENVRFNKVRLRGDLNKMREQIESSEMIGAATAEDHTLLAVLEFHFKEFSNAEKEFKRAVAIDPLDPDKLFNYGLMEHFMKKWFEAKTAYQMSLRLREFEPGHTELDMLKKEFTKLLITKVDFKIPLDGKRGTGWGRGAGDAAPAAIRSLWKWLAPDVPFEDYAVKIAPKAEEAMFTLVPFAIFSAFLASGALGFSGYLLGMAASYGIFLGMHIPNMWRAPPYVNGIMAKAKYVFISPLKVALMDLGLASIFGALLLPLSAGEPASYQAFVSLIVLAALLYAATNNYHKGENMSALEGDERAPAAILPPEPESIGKEMVFRQAALKVLRAQTDENVASFGDYGRAYTYKDAVHREDYTLVTERCYHVTTKDNLPEILSTMRIEAKQSITDFGAFVSRPDRKHVERWRASDGSSFRPEFLEGYDVALEFVTTPLAEGKARFIVHPTSKDSDWMKFTEDIELKPSEGMVRGTMRVIVEHRFDVPYVEKSIIELSERLKGYGVSIEVVSMDDLETEIELQRDAFLGVTASDAAQDLPRLADIMGPEQGDELSGRKPGETAKPPAELIISDPLPSDMDAVYELSKEIFPSVGGMAKVKFLEHITRSKGELIPLAYLKVAKVGGEVVGYILAVQPDVIGSDSELHIWHVAVKKDHREKGIAGALIENVVRQAMGDGYRVFTVHPKETLTENTEKRFRDNGFDLERRDSLCIIRFNEARAAAGDKGATNGDPDPAKTILSRASVVIPALVNAMMKVSKKDERTLLVLDNDLGEGAARVMVEELIRSLETVDDNNGEIKKFLESLERISGAGEELAARVVSLTDDERGSFDPKNVIVITSEKNMDLYGPIEGKGTIAAIDDLGFSPAAYLPLLEVILFAIGKHLGWDEEELRRSYSLITNAIDTEKLPSGDLVALFGQGIKTFIIRLIPDAEELGTEKIREITDILKDMLSKA